MSDLVINNSIIHKLLTLITSFNFESSLNKYNLKDVLKFCKYLIIKSLNTNHYLLTLSKIACTWLTLCLVASPYSWSLP